MSIRPPVHSATLILALMLALPASAAQPAASLPLYVGQPMEGASVVYGDLGGQKPLDGDANRPGGGPVSLRRSAKDAGADALQLVWKDTWISLLRVNSQPLDLRSYLGKGTLSFDLKVNELAKGGVTFRLDCGSDCERRVTYALPARAFQGQGWKRVSLRLACFYRKGDDFSKVTQPFTLEGMGAGDVEVANIRISNNGQPNGQPNGKPSGHHAASCPDYRTASVTPSPQEESWALDWWMPRHNDKLAEIQRRRAAGQRTGLVFIGDSITHGWENDGKAVWERLYQPHNALNLGYGGDRTENVLWRLQHGEVDGIDPRVAVMMIGTNNTGHRHEDAALTVAGIKRDIAELKKRLPRTRILLLAVFPRDESPNGKLRLINEKINAVLPQLADGKKVFFLNINKAFLQPDGTLSKDIMPDLLHPNAKGYQLWADAMQPELDRLMRD